MTTEEILREEESELIPTNPLPQANIPDSKFKPFSEENMQRVKAGTNVFDVINEIYKPSIDEKALKNNRTAAGIGDGLRLLGQMFSAGKGAHISQDNPANSAVSQNRTREDKLRELYRQQDDAQKRMHYQAALENIRKKDAERIRQENINRENTRYQDQVSWRENQQKYKEEKDKLSEEYRNKVFNENQAQHQASNELAKKRINASANKTGKDANNTVTAKRMAMQQEAQKTFVDAISDEDFVDSTELLDRKGDLRKGINIYVVAEAYKKYKANKEKENNSPEENKNTGGIY
jgi:hypothetical protein